MFLSMFVIFFPHALCVIGGHAPAFRSNLQTVTSSLDDYSLESVPLCGHQPHVEKPHQVLDAMVKWLKMELQMTMQG